MLVMEGCLQKRRFGVGRLGHRILQRVARLTGPCGPLRAPSVPRPERFPPTRIEVTPVGGRCLAASPLSRVPAPRGPLA
jgi:hypothetical protein